jgi:hypothetical protein
VVESVHATRRAWLQVRVCLFGSVPIYTYLPDGDIDLTFYLDESSPATEIPQWANRLQKHFEKHLPRRAGVQSAQSKPGLQGSSQQHSQFPASSAAGVNVPCHVQSVTVIPAEVTLVKCNVRAPAPTDRTIVVDISFKQHGGVNAAAFLEEADRFIDAYTASQQGAFQQRECEVHITALAICGVSATF